MHDNVITPECNFGKEQRKSKKKAGVHKSSPGSKREFTHKKGERTFPTQTQTAWEKGGGGGGPKRHRRLVNMQLTRT